MTQIWKKKNSFFIELILNLTLSIYYFEHLMWDNTYIFFDRMRFDLFNVRKYIYFFNRKI